MIRGPPRSTLDRSSAASDVYKRQAWNDAAAVIRLLRQTQPEAAEHLRDLGLVYYQQRRLTQAAHYLDAYLQRAPDAADAQVIRDGMKDLLDEWVAQN